MAESCAVEDKRLATRVRQRFGCVDATMSCANTAACPPSSSPPPACPSVGHAVQVLREQVAHPAPSQQKPRSGSESRKPSTRPSDPKASELTRGIRRRSLRRRAARHSSPSSPPNGQPRLSQTHDHAQMKAVQIDGCSGLGRIRTTKITRQ